MAVLEAGQDQLLALSVAEVVWSRPGQLRREALSDIEKVLQCSLWLGCSAAMAAYVVCPAVGWITHEGCRAASWLARACCKSTRDTCVAVA